MKRLALTIVSGCLFAGIASAQSDKDLIPTNQSTESAAHAVNGPLTDGATINATLSKTVDSRKLKKGDEVTARTIDATKENGKTVIPANALIRGHVTQASARDKGDSFSAVGIVFDKAILKNGEAMPISVTVQAIALPAAAVDNVPNPAMDTAALGHGTSQADANRQAPLTVPDTLYGSDTNQVSSGKPVGPVDGGLNDSGVLKPNSQGVYGLRGIGLATSTVGGQEAAVITSVTKAVHLDSGTQLLLVTQPVATQTSATY